MADFNLNCYVPAELERYKPVSIIGSGAFGIVYRAVDGQSNDHVVMKYGNEKSRQKGYSILNREMDILKGLQHQNIIRLVDSFKAIGHVDNESAILVLEGCACDLTVLKSTVGFTDRGTKTVICHILNGLSYLEDQKIIHCDVKPNNILLSYDGRMKLCDFGSARSFDSQAEKSYFSFSYASVEMLLGAKRLDYKTDSWCAGCILAELICGEQLFYETTRDAQIEQVFDFCGTFRRDAWNALLPILPEQYQQKYYVYREGTIGQFFEQNIIQPEARYLIGRLLMIDRKNRWTGKEALSSDYVHSGIPIFEHLKHFLIAVKDIVQ